MKLSKAYRRVRHAADRTAEDWRGGIAVRGGRLVATDGHRLVMAPLDRGVELEGRGLTRLPRGLLDGDLMEEAPPDFPKVAQLEQVVPVRRDGSGVMLHREDVVRVAEAVEAGKKRAAAECAAHRAQRSVLVRVRNATKRRSAARAAAEKALATHVKNAPVPWPVVEVRVGDDGGLEVRPRQTFAAASEGWAALNGAYLMDALKRVRGDVRLQLTDEFTAVRLDDVDGVTEVIMPVRPAPAKKGKR